MPIRMAKLNRAKFPANCSECHYASGALIGRPTLRVRFPRGGVANAGSLRHGPQRGRAVPLVPPSAPHGVAMFSRCLSGRLQPPHWQRLGLGLTRSMPVARPAPLKIRTRAQRLRSPLKLRTPADTGSGPSGWACRARRASPKPGDHASLSLSLSGPPATGTRRPSWEQPPGGASERQLDTRSESPIKGRRGTSAPSRDTGPGLRSPLGDSEGPNFSFAGPFKLEGFRFKLARGPAAGLDFRPEKKRDSARTLLRLPGPVPVASFAPEGSLPVASLSRTT